MNLIYWLTKPYVVGERSGALTYNALNGPRLTVWHAMIRTRWHAIKCAVLHGGHVYGDCTIMRRAYELNQRIILYGQCKRCREHVYVATQFPSGTDPDNRYLRKLMEKMAGS